MQHHPETSAYRQTLAAASYLSVAVTAAVVAGSEFQDITVSNSHPSQGISISQMTLTWLYNDPVVQANRVKFDSTTVWTGSAASGETLSTPRTLAVGASDALAIRFTGNMSDACLEMRFIMSDGSSRTALADFRINQANYLNIDTTYSNISGNKLQNLQLQNTHFSSKIWLEKMQISVSPNTSQTVEGISIDSSSKFGPSSDPDDLNIPLDITLTEIDTSPMTQDITFSTLSSLHDFTLTYTMRDGTIKTVTRNFASEGPASGSLSGSTQNVTLTTGLDLVENFAVSRNGTAPISFQQMKLSWTPIGSVKLKEITIDGTKLFNNSSGVNSGTEVTLTSSTTLTASDSIIDLKFSNDIPNTDITVEFVLSDGSRKAFTALLNPGNSAVWVAGDNFEDGQEESGGAGFASNWAISDSSSPFKTGGNSYSGNNHLRLRQQYTARRTLTNSATKSSQKVTYVVRLGSYNNGETGYVETRIGGTGPWTTIRAIAPPTFANNTFYRFTDTVLMTIGQKFEIQFRGGASNTNEYFYIDELFFEK